MTTPLDEMNNNLLDPFGFEGDGRELPPWSYCLQHNLIRFLGTYGKSFLTCCREGPAKVGEPQINLHKKWL